MTILGNKNERRFQKSYEHYSKKTGLNPNPDDPRHYYDYRGAWQKGEGFKPILGHLSSEFKQEGHPRMILDGVNTKTGRRVK